jgi:hypothetical protein
MDAVTIGFALMIGVIVVGMKMRSHRPHRASDDNGGSFAWFGGDSGGSTDCGSDGGTSGGDCGGGGDGGGGGD